MFAVIGLFTARLFILLVILLLAGCSSAGPTLDQQIGQMLMVGFRGMEVDENHFIVQDIRQRNLGGVILFDYDVSSEKRVRNIESPEQVKSLVTSLQEISATPLLIAVDQEGGRIARLQERSGFPATRSHMDLGGQDDLQVTFAETRKLATTLAEIGFVINMAPVVDLCINPDNPIIAKYERCFSADPQKVTNHALSYISAHQQRGVLTTLKHFPGHGSSHADSHLGLADITDTWSEIELVPYRQIIDAGRVDAVMTAHVFNAQLDAQYPASLSKVTIDGILRQQLGFDGVVISDDMQMRAITDSFGFETAIFKALEAGVDILLFGNNLDYDEQVVAQAIIIIRNLVLDKKLSAARIDQSYRRILKLKKLVD